MFPSNFNNNYRVQPTYTYNIVVRFQLITYYSLQINYVTICFFFHEIKHDIGILYYFIILWKAGYTSARTGFSTFSSLVPSWSLHYVYVTKHIKKCIYHRRTLSKVRGIGLTMMYFLCVFSHFRVVKVVQKQTFVVLQRECF